MSDVIIDIHGIRTNWISTISLGVFLSGIPYLWRWIQAAKLNRKHSLSGSYITYYEDTDLHGNKHKRKALLELKQRGKEIEAATKDIASDRAWTLSGAIIDQGRLTGTYEPGDPSDPGRGTFFLERIQVAGVIYEGVWAGFDSTTRRVSVGAFRWRKLLPVKIRRLTKKDEKHLQAVLSLFADSLGNGFIPESRIREILADARNCVLFGAFHKGALVAVRTAWVLSPQKVTAFEGEVRQAGGNLALSSYKVGTLAALAVKPEYRRKGLGAQMVIAGIEWLKQAGCTRIVATAWDSQSVESSSRLLETFDFRCFGVSREHWKEESLTKGYQCPRCGSPPCLCTAKHYVKCL